MALVAQTRQRDRELHGPGTLLDLCLASGLPVASACSGRGACGRCLMTILSGAETLPVPEQREADLLLKVGAGADQRLGCQCAAPATGDLLLTTGYW
jgi:ferredoxin